MFSKKTNLYVVIAFLSLKCTVQGQGTIYFSNLNQTPSGSASIGADSWVATSFNTGTNAGGYIFNYVTVEMADATGNPGSVAIALYSSFTLADAFPKNNLNTLSGSLTPVVGGLYNYTPSSALTLLPSTTYFIVMLSDTSVNAGAFQWSSEQSYTVPGFDGWQSPNIGGGIDIYQSSNNGNLWGGSFYTPQFAINATPVPEPSALTLLGMSSLVLAASSCVRMRGKS